MHDRGLPPRAALHEDRPSVARPTAIRGMENELDAAQISSRAREIALCELLISLAVDEDADNLTRANLANDFPIDPADSIDLVGPVHLIMRPDQPGRLMSLPFRGHGEAERGGRGRRGGRVVGGFVLGHRKGAKISARLASGRVAWRALSRHA